MPLSKVHRNALIQHKNFKDFSEKGHSPLPKLHRDCVGANEFFWKGAQNWLRNDGYASIKNTQNALIPHKNSKKICGGGSVPLPRPHPTAEGTPPPHTPPTRRLRRLDSAPLPRARPRRLRRFGTIALSRLLL